MSVHVMSHVWKHGPADRSELLILLALADFSDDDGYCWPSMEAVAKKARMGERGAQKVVRRLQETGWISVQTGGGRHGCNNYQINLKKPEQETPNPVHPEPRSPRTGVQKPRTRVQETPNGGSPEPSGTIKEPSERAKVRDVLCEVAGDEAVASFMAYRSKQKGKAMTLTGAKRLANHLQKIKVSGGDADDALALAEERGWQSVEPGWYFRETAKSERHISQQSGKTVPRDDWKTGSTMAPAAPPPPPRRNLQN